MALSVEYRNDTGDVVLILDESGIALIRSVLNKIESDPSQNNDNIDHSDGLSQNRNSFSDRFINATGLKIAYRNDIV